MKTLVLIILLFFAVGSSIAQGVRTFYQSYSDSKFSNSMFEYNDEVYFISIKDSSSSMLKIVCGKLDDNLNTSNYRYLSILKESNTLHQLSGCSVNGNYLLLAILRRTETNKNALNYITIDLNTFDVVSNVSETQFFNIGFVKSLDIEGELITYLQGENNILYRINNNAQTFTLGTQTIIDTFPSYVSYLAEHLFLNIYSGNEFVMIRTAFDSFRLYKIDEVGSISHKSIQLPSSQGMHALSILSNGNLIAAGKSNYIQFNQNLDSLTAGVFPVSVSSSPLNGIKWVLYSKDNLVYDIRENGKKFVYDLTISLVDSTVYDRKLMPLGILEKGNDVFLYGEVKNPTQVNSLEINGYDEMKSDIFVVKNFSTDAFSEFGRTINHHNLQFNTGSCGTSFINGGTGVNGYSYTVEGKQVGTIFSKSNTLLGLTDQNQLSGFYGRYNGLMNILPGPISTSVADGNETIDKYNRGYYVTKQMIQDHLTILFYGNPNYQPPHGIRDWPAHGNVSNGEAENIAAFVDVNNNGIYEPLEGDYPKIYGDKCLLNIYHQSGDGPTNNNLEVHEYYFTFDCDTSEVLKNTVFENMRVINRGVYMDSTHVGTFLDYDIGGSADDYIGTNIELGLVYAYNADAYDDTDGSSLGFNQYPPAQGMLVLNGMKLNSNNSDNPIGVAVGESINGNGFGDGVADNEYSTLETSFHSINASVFYDPNTVNEFWNVLNAKNIDGSPRTIAPGVEMRYSYYGNSDPLFYGSRGYDHGNNSFEFTNLNPPGDRRIIAGSGSGMFASGDTINYLIAHVTSFDSTEFTVPIAPVKLFTDAQWLKTAFQTNDLGCGNTFGPIQNDLGLVEKEQYTVTIYPNPFNNELYISNLSSGLNTIEILNLDGKIVYQTSSFGEKSVLNLDILPGFYLISISNSLGNVVKRIVKN